MCDLLNPGGLVPLQMKVPVQLSQHLPVELCSGQQFPLAWTEPIIDANLEHMLGHTTCNIGLLHLILGLSVEGEQTYEAFSLLIWVCVPGGYFAGDNACKTENITCLSLLASS